VAECRNSQDVPAPELPLKIHYTENGFAIKHANRILQL
jgi:hypothetical protein